MSAAAKGDDADVPESNKKWKAYTFICITSFVSFVSCADVLGVETAYEFFILDKQKTVTLMFGIVTFLLSLIILVVDIFGKIRRKIDFKSIREGKVEGLTLLAFVIWWIAGVIVTTQAGGVAYKTLNAYVSSWASLFSCIYGLDKWGAEKEVMTLHELTRLSPTLPWWWIVLFASVVVFGSAVDASKLVQSQSAQESCAFAVGVGIVGASIAGFFILSHYEMMQCCGACNTWLSYGGCFEISCTLLLTVWLTIGLDNLTGAGRIGSTITGNGLEPNREDYIPGSNIYVSIWTAFIASIIVAVKWKEARAIKFAETAEGQTVRGESGLRNEYENSDDDI